MLRIFDSVLTVLTYGWHALAGLDISTRRGLVPLGFATCEPPLELSFHVLFLCPLEKKHTCNKFHIGLPSPALCRTQAGYGRACSDPPKTLSQDLSGLILFADYPRSLLNEELGKPAARVSRLQVENLSTPWGEHLVSLAWPTSRQDFVCGCASR